MINISKQPTRRMPLTKTKGDIVASLIAGAMPLPRSLKTKFLSL